MSTVTLRPSTWITQVFDDGQSSPESKSRAKDIGSLVNAAFDKEGGLHAVYNAYNVLRYAFHPAQNLDRQILHRSLVATTRNPGNTELASRLKIIPFAFDPQSRHISLNVDASSRPHVIFSSLHGLQYVILSPGGWSLGLISDHAMRNKPWTILFDSKDIPLLIMNHLAAGLVIARLKTSGWQEERVALPPDAADADLMCLGAQINNETLHFALITHQNMTATLWSGSMSVDGAPGPTPIPK
ncbi:MAG: hypothetical protein AAB091_02880, partial [Elusimicrobiota bacterium]